MSPHPVAPDSSPAIVPESPLVSNAKLRQIYTFMLHCRAIRARIGSLTAEGRVAVELLPAAGEEATLASSAIELRAGDSLCCARRDWLPAMLKGIPLAKIARWLLSNSASGPYSRHGAQRAQRVQRILTDNAHRLHALPSRPETQLAVALEAAAAHKRRKESLALAWIGNDMPAGAWQQALQLASRRRLPLLFVCRTGSAQPDAHDYSALTLPSQTPHIHVDGNDALAVYRVAQEATGRARRGLGPTLIECRFESQAASAGSGEREPAADSFAVMERHLAAKGVFSEAWKREIEESFAQQLEAALVSAERRITARAAMIGSR